MEQQQQSRKKRITKKIPTKADKEAGILATIESVVAGGSLGMVWGNSVSLKCLELRLGKYFNPK